MRVLMFCRGMRRVYLDGFNYQLLFRANVVDSSLRWGCWGWQLERCWSVDPWTEESCTTTLTSGQPLLGLKEMFNAKRCWETSAGWAGKLTASVRVALKSTIKPEMGPVEKCAWRKEWESERFLYRNEQERCSDFECCAVLYIHSCIVFRLERPETGYLQEFYRKPFSTLQIFCEELQIS